LEVDERFEQAGAIEIWPEDFSDEDFGVGNLPEQEITYTHFAAGADEEIGIGEIGSVEMARDLFFGDGCVSGVAIAFGEDRIHGVDDFRAATVIQGDGKDHAGVACCGFHCFLGVSLNSGGQIVRTAKKPHADIVALEKRHLFANVFAQELHEEFDFGLGAAPVFDREGVQGERFDVQASAGLDGGAGGLRAGSVSRDAREVALLGPTAISVHDDGDMAGEAGRIELGKELRLFTGDGAEAVGERRESRELESRMGHSQPIR
jgi:hypothetical protein